MAEQFPRLIHRMLDPKTVILIFASGKLTCVGAKQEDVMHCFVNQIHSALEKKSNVLLLIGNNLQK